MPTYDYACDSCGHRFEIRQSFSDEPLTVCPECQGHIRRVIHPSGIIFKGSGWYITDSRDAKSAVAPVSDSGSADTAPAESTAAETKSSDASTTSSKTAADD